ncbi:MAG: hypothetical protein IPK99_03410 [Flavobacteriales bacterium]|nr:hypothetical protein [Flavobacteriales bacterium]
MNKPLPIDHALLDLYEQHKGEPERMSPADRDKLKEAWALLDELLMDLHMVRHGYAHAGYAKHLDRRIDAHCADEHVAERLRALWQ